LHKKGKQGEGDVVFRFVRETSQEKRKGGGTPKKGVEVKGGTPMKRAMQKGKGQQVERARAGEGRRSKCLVQNLGGEGGGRGGTN